MDLAKIVKANKKCVFRKSTDIYHYIHAGRGLVVLESPSGKSHTYMFEKPNSTDTFPDDVIFVYTFSEGKKFYVGMMEDDKFRITRHSRFLPDTEIVKGAFYIVKMSKSQRQVDDNPMMLYHLGSCGRCGRLLTSDDAIESGIGKKCRKILGI